MGYKTFTCDIAKKCGGCEWLSVPYPIQLKRKQEAFEKQLGAQVAADGGELLPIVGMEGDPLAYRHKAATPLPTRAATFAAASTRLVPTALSRARNAW